MCWDNAWAESFKATLKNERVHRMVYPTKDKAALRVWGCGRWGLSAGLGGCCQVVFEASGVDEAADGVVREVAQAQGDAA